MLALVLAVVLAAGGAAGAVLDALFPEARRTVELRELAANPLAPDRDFRIEEIGRDAHTSHHVVWIRDREVPHRHDRREGSILYVPRGTPHAFRNASDEPAVAYAVYAPAFDGKDRVTEPRDD